MGGDEQPFLCGRGTLQGVADATGQPFSEPSEFSWMRTFFGAQWVIRKSASSDGPVES